MGPILGLGVLEERKLPLSMKIIEPRSLEHVPRSLDTMPTAMFRLSIVCRVTEADICGYGAAQVTVCNYTIRYLLTHCGRVTQICVFNTVKLGTSASSP